MRKGKKNGRFVRDCQKLVGSYRRCQTENICLVFFCYEIKKIVGLTAMIVM